MRGRGKALREQSVVNAFDAVRILGDAKAGKMKHLGEYLDQLLPEAELAARSEEAFFAKLDRQIAAAANED